MFITLNLGLDSTFTLPNLSSNEIEVINLVVPTIVRRALGEVVPIPMRPSEVSVVVAVAPK